MWQEIEIKSFKQFVEQIKALNPHWPNSDKWMFRGQSDQGWSLEPSLLRLFRGQGLASSKLVQIEQDMKRVFKSEAHRFLAAPYLSEFGSDVTHWWALMRHYRAPTRILDWTLSPYVALYFGVEDQWKLPGAVWCVRGKAIGKAFAAANPAAYKNTWKNRKAAKGNPFTLPDPLPLLYVYDMEHQIDRIAAQQGRFTVCTDALQDHALLLNKHLARDDLYKLVIPPKHKPEFMRELHLMNIAAKALFPGIEGLGRSIEEIARLSIRFDRPPPPTDGSIDVK